MLLKNAKKVVYLITAILVLTLAVTGCGKPANNGSQKKQQLVISTWGGASETGIREIAKAFEEENNVELIFDTGNNSDRLNKLRATKGNPQIDIALLSDTFADLGNEEGLFDTIDPEKVPNLSKLYDFALEKNGYGPAYSVTRWGIVYDSEKIDKAPDSWNDMWDPAYKGKIAIPDMTSTAGPMFLIKAAELNGGDAKNTDPGFEKIKEIEDAKIYVGHSEVLNMFEREEIVMTVFMDIFVPGLQEAGLPIKWADAKEGSFAVFNTINITKGTQNKELAEKFVNFMLSEEAQKKMSETLFEAPVNKDTIVKEEIAKDMAYGTEKVESLIVFDREYINNMKNEWIEKWNKEIATK